MGNLIILLCLFVVFHFVFLWYFGLLFTNQSKVIIFSKKYGRRKNIMSSLKNIVELLNILGDKQIMFIFAKKSIDYETKIDKQGGGSDEHHLEKR